MSNTINSLSPKSYLPCLSKVEGTKASTQQPSMQVSKEQAIENGDKIALSDYASKTIDIGAGLGNAAMALVTNSAAGGAEGILYGAQVNTPNRNTLFDMAMTANLFLTGTITAGPLGGIANVAQGEAYWSQEPDQFKQEVLEAARKWTDTVIGIDSPQLRNNPTPMMKVVYGAIGEVVGSIAGAVIGARRGYEYGVQASQAKLAEWKQGIKSSEVSA